MDNDTVRELLKLTRQKIVINCDDTKTARIVHDCFTDMIGDIPEDEPTDDTPDDFEEHNTHHKGGAL